MKYRIFKGDKWTRLLGSRIPIGALVQVVRFMPRRRVIIKFGQEVMTTMLWCLVKPKPHQVCEAGLDG
jgi:hypothetical protein